VTVHLQHVDKSVVVRETIEFLRQHRYNRGFE
jgi:hypothetical protein